VPAAGADAVRIGTLLCATHEADVHPEYLQALLAAHAEDTVLTETFSTMWPDAPHRVLRSCIEVAEATEQDVIGEARMGEITVPIPRLAPMAPTTAVTGRIQAMALYAGESVGEVNRVRPAGEVVRDLADGAERLLRERAALLLEPKDRSTQT
jgi:nitronate monooxygenase